MMGAASQHLNRAYDTNNVRRGIGVCVIDETPIIARILDELEEAIRRYDNCNHDYKLRLQHRGIKKGLQLAYTIVSNSMGFSLKQPEVDATANGAIEPQPSGLHPR